MQSVRGFQRRPVQSVSAGHVEISFVNRRHFDLWAERAQNFVDFLRTLTVALGMSVDKYGMRTLLGRGTQRHGRMHAKLACFVRGCGNHATLVPLPADHDRLAFQRRIEEFFHGNEESVHIDVEDGAGEPGLLGGSHAEESLAAASAPRLTAAQPGCKLRSLT